MKRIPEYIARAKDKDDPFRLMGFGHRVYKNFDPRAKVMKATADEVLKELNISDPVLDVAKELEHIALNDDYFIEKKLYPNVDFYSGVILNAIGFPTDMFTALFALARTVGWVAQWNEMIADPEQKIGRPRQLYIGATQRDYVPVEQALGAPEASSVKRAPSPGALSSVTSPPIERASRREMARPRPVPLAPGLSAFEPLEDPLLVGRIDARSLISDSHGRRARRAREAAGAIVPPSGEWRMALPIRLTRIWMTARSSPVARKRIVLSDWIATPCSSAEDSSIITASAASAERSIPCWLVPDPRSSSARPRADGGRLRRCRCHSSHSRCATGRRRARRSARRFR